MERFIKRKDPEIHSEPQTVTIGSIVTLRISDQLSEYEDTFEIILSGSFSDNKGIKTLYSDSFIASTLIRLQAKPGFELPVLTREHDLKIKVISVTNTH